MNKTKKGQLTLALEKEVKTSLLRFCEDRAYFLSATGAGAGAAATFSAFLSALCAFFSALTALCSAFFSSLAAFMSALASTFAGAAAGAAGAWAKTPAAKKPAINVASNLFMRNTPSFQLSAQHCVELVNTTCGMDSLMTRCQPSCNLLYLFRKCFSPSWECMIHVKQIGLFARHG